MTQDQVVAETPIPSLLRPNQVEERLEEKAGITEMLQQPAYIQSQIEDRGAMVRQLKAIERSLDVGTPREYHTPERLDRAVKAELELREELTSTMLSRDELMKNPPGAPDKLIRWERENKNKVLAWKNLRLRLHASGVDFGYDTNVANLEIYRPGSRGSDLNMNMGVQVGGKTEFHFGTDPVNAVVFTEDDLAAIQEMNPELFGRLAFSSNLERRQIRNVLDGKDPMDGIDLPSTKKGKKAAADSG